MIGVTAVALSSDGRSLASGDGAGRVILWSLETLQPRVFLGPRPHTRGIAHIEFVPESSRFVALDLDGQAVLWDASGEQIRPKTLTKGAGAIACGDQWIAAAVKETGKPGALLFFRPDGSALPSLTTNLGPVTTGNLIVDGRLGDVQRPARVIAGDTEGRLIVASVADRKIARSWTFNEAIDSIALVDGGVIAAVGSSLRAAEFKTGAVQSIATSGRLVSLTVSRDQRYLAAVSATGDLNAWQLEGSQVTKPVSLAEGDKSWRTISVAFASHGGLLVSGDQDGGIRAWTLADGSARARIAPRRGKVESLALARDGRFLLQIDHDRQAKVWDLSEGRGTRTISGKWTSGAFLADGKALAMTTREGRILLVDRETGVTGPQVFESPMTADGKPSSWGFAQVVVSADGKSLAAASDRGPLVAVWSLDGGVPKRSVSR